MPDDAADPKALGTIVRSFRKALGWSQSKLADKLGIDQTTVSQYEIGRALPSTEVLLKMGALAPNEGLRETIGREVRMRFSGFWEETFFALSEADKKAFLNAFMQPPSRRFTFDLAAVLSRPEAPEFLREIVSLYLKVRKQPSAQRVFEQATTWLRVQLQMAEAARQGNSAAEGIAELAADLQMAETLETQLRALKRDSHTKKKDGKKGKVAS